MSQSSQLIETAQRTIRLEIEAVEQLNARIDASFVQACELILACKGRVVVVGMGKSGHIGRKIAATLASTGTAAFFVHPAEASHGDMGMITPDDVVLALSNSGTTSEIVTLLPLIKRLGITLISMTGNPSSVLAKAAAVNLDASVAIEACPLNLAPTSSTTASLVLGDALAIALLEARGFTAEDFAFFPSRWCPWPTPAAQGRTRHAHWRTSPQRAPRLAARCPSGNDAERAGHDRDRRDRRAPGRDFHRWRPASRLDKGVDVRQTLIDEVMTVHGKTANAEMLAAEALKIMEDHKISSLVVIDEQGCHRRPEHA